jgi:hypothetical protein
MSDTLRCTKCQRDLPVDDFARDSKAHSRGFRRHACRECAADGDAVLRERNRQLIREAKDVPCMDGTMCGGKRFPPHIMQFDHVPGRGKKDFSIGSEGRSFSEQKVKDEIAKCDVVCSNCHDDRTYKRLREKLERGESVGCIVPRGTRLSPKTQTPSLPDELTLF